MEYRKDDEKSGGVGFVTLIYMVLLFGSICAYICFRIKTHKVRRTKFNEFFNNINKNTYNARGIQWIMMWAPKLQYIQIIFKDPKEMEML